MNKPFRPGSSSLRRGRVSVAEQIYHVTSRAVRGTSPFTDFDVASEMCKAFHRVGTEGRGRVLAWVLMPDHAHWLVQLEADSSLSGLVATLKRESAQAVNLIAANPRGTALWMPGFHDRAIPREDDLLAVARYLVANPPRAGLTARLGDYPFWDSIWL